MDPIAQARALINSWLGGNKQQKPLSQPSGNAVNTKFGQIPFQGPKSLGPKTVTAAEPSSTPFPSATPMPAPASDDDFHFAFEALPRDEGWSKNGPRPNFTPKQPPSDIAKIIRDLFPDEATAAAAIAVSENGRYASGKDADNIWNKDGSIDRGIFAINSNTFNGLMERQPKKLQALGVNSFEDMHDPRKNAEVAKLIRADAKQANPKTQGWGRWFGWQDVGFELNNDYYSKSDRVDYELKQRGRK